MSQNDAMFQELDGYLQSVVEHLAANQRRRLSRQIATGLRKRQQQRIAQQKNPDGSSYEGRKKKTRRTQGGVRFLWKGEARELRNWHSSKGRSGERMITGFDVGRGGLRSFLRADIDHYLSINVSSVSTAPARKEKMFRKLRTVRFLRIDTSPNSAAVGFSGHAARIAHAHQFGETDKIGRSSVRYPIRELLGLTPSDLDWVASEITDFIQPD
ncbi:phage virion morphogenesis protein [Pectobacterium aquaticum]|uniref:phage virion morphogenesis protein n=1 Tax=Pectobacterium aquaticum TaxID=2204145 RepID=UPI000E222E50|nr:phage virion morphogenesis protein [Pectobacterium aquaticum]RRO02447.1 phage virion morphogenesis protein [Pectobacterium aquaticum]